MSFSYDPGNISGETIDRVRFLLGDTTTPDHLLEDEELQELLSETGTSREAAARAAEHLAARFARLADQKAGRVSVQYSQLHDQWIKLAETIRGGGSEQFVGSYLGGVEHSDIREDHEDPDVKNAVFSRGMHNAPGTAQDASTKTDDHRDNFF